MFTPRLFPAMLLIVAGIFFTIAGHGQIVIKSVAGKVHEALNPETIDWSDGAVTMNDGVEFKGAVKYNDRTGILYYENNQEQKALTPRRVITFEFTDRQTNGRRIFYSLPQQTDVGEHHFFFEVLKQFETFAVLSKISPIDVEIDRAKTNRGAIGNRRDHAINPITDSKRTDIRQYETIYFMDSDGALHPYVHTMRREIDRLAFDRTRIETSRPDQDILKKFIGESFEKIEKYAKENELNFEVREDLVRALDFYEDLISK